MFTRTVVVPKDREAMHSLDYDNAKESQLLELSLEEKQFQVLWTRGVFELIKSWGRRILMLSKMSLLRMQNR